MSKKLTGNAGGRIERKAVRAYLRRQKDKAKLDLKLDVVFFIDRMIEWLIFRPVRYRKRPGGLGPRAK